MKRFVPVLTVGLLALTACSDDATSSTPTSSPSTSADDTAAPTTDGSADTTAPAAPSTSADASGDPAFEPAACFPAIGITDGVDVRCGTVTVPMGGAGTTDVSLFVTVVGTADPATAESVLFHLPGGPGASAESYAPILASTYLPLAEAIGRPIVFVDQRGTGRSTPFLECPDPSETAACVDAWEADGIDPLAFTTARAADDIVTVADALGAGRVDLWGASYGSRLALETVRRHGDRVRSLAIESVDTAASPLDDAVDVRAALLRAGEECAADPACAAVVPDLVTAVDATAAAVDTDPFITAFGQIDGAAFVGTIGELMQWARGVSYVPTYVAAVRDRDVAATQAVQLAVSQAPFPGGQFSEAMFQLVNCTDLAPFDPVATIDALDLADTDLLGRLRAESGRASLGDACVDWPVNPDAPTEPVTSDVPALVIAGSIDSNTPLENAELAAATLSSSTLVSFPSTGHFPAHQGGNPCALTILAAFVTDPTAEVDTSCVPAPSTVATLPAPGEATLATTAMPTIGIAADVPQGWLSLDGTTYATAGAALRIQLVPGGVDDVVAGLAQQFDIDPTTAVEETIAGAPWTTLEADVDGSATTVLLTQADTFVLLVLVATEDGTDPASIAVPVVESIMPL